MTVPNADDGSISLWMLGLSVMLLLLGGISIDLWHVAATRQTLADMADAAAIAGATQIDEDQYREGNHLELTPSAARNAASRQLQSDGRLEGVAVSLDATAERLVVTMQVDVPLGLSRILLGDQPPLRLRVRATAEPRVGP